MSAIFIDAQALHGDKMELLFANWALFITNICNNYCTDLHYDNPPALFQHLDARQLWKTQTDSKKRFQMCFVWNFWPTWVSFTLKLSWTGTCDWQRETSSQLKRKSRKPLIICNVGSKISWWTRLNWKRRKRHQKSGKSGSFLLNHIWIGGWVCVDSSAAHALPGSSKMERKVSFHSFIRTQAFLKPIFHW